VFTTSEPRIPTAGLDLPGFGLEVRGEGLAGEHLHDGDMAWVEPRSTPRSGQVVLARIRCGKQWRLRMCRLLTCRSTGRAFLSVTTALSRVLVIWDEFEVIGPVVGILSALSSQPSPVRAPRHRRRRAAKHLGASA
jgi:hypothetical protein